MAELPLLDLERWEESCPADRARAVATVQDACARFGFLALTGTHLEETIKRASAAATRFFQKTRESKMEVGARGSAYGYFPMKSEALGYAADVQKQPDLREAFSCGPLHPPPTRLRATEDPGMRAVVDFCYEQTPWPDADLQAALTDFYEQCAELGSTVLRIMAIALDLPEDHFSLASSRGVQK